MLEYVGAILSVDVVRVGISIQLKAMTTDIAVRGHDYNGRIEDYDEYDENSSARLFERSRIKALAGRFDSLYFFRHCKFRLSIYICSFIFTFIERNS